MHVWAWFWDMDCAERLTSVDINAWCQLREVKLRGWELSALRAMDDARAEWRAKPDAEKKYMPATADNLKTAMRSRASGDPNRQVRKK